MIVHLEVVATRGARPRPAHKSCRCRGLRCSAQVQKDPDATRRGRRRRGHILESRQDDTPNAPPRRSPRWCVRLPTPVLASDPPALFQRRIMKLVNAKVTYYRSVEDSEEFTVEPEVTCLVG